MEINEILICGGGNATHTLIPILRKKFSGKINLFLPIQSELKQFNHLITSSGKISVTFGSETFSGSINNASNLPEEVCNNADLILLPIPAFIHEPIFKKIIPFVKLNSIIGAIPARGGFEFSSLNILKVNKREDIKIFGMQTLPWACRIRKYASRVDILGIKDSVGLATYPHKSVFEITKTLTNLLSIDIEPLPNLLTLTLANIGQIVHPGIMYGLFKGRENMRYKKEEIPLFYQGVNREIAEILNEMSKEIQRIVSVITSRYKKIDLSHVLPLKDWLIKSYPNDIVDKSTIMSCFTTNRAYNGLQAPMKISNGYYIPNFNSRYLTEDIPFGLLVTYSIAYLAGVEVPIIKRVIKKTSKWMNKEYLVNSQLIGKDIQSTRIPQNYFLNSINEIVKF